MRTSLPERARGSISRFGVPLGMVVGFVAALLGAALVAPAALLHRDAGSLEQSYGRTVVSLVARFMSGGIGPNPVAGNPEAIRAGRQSYTGSCALCHGLKGDGNGPFGQATFPPASDLTSQPVRELSEQQLFFVIKHGLSFTAMPGYARQYSDDKIWNIVSFLRALQRDETGAQEIPDLTTEELVFADFHAGSEAQRGAAIFFSQGCTRCHGARANLPGQPQIDPTEVDVRGAVRLGTRKGMPVFTPDVIPDEWIGDLEAYIATLP